MHEPSHALPDLMQAVTLSTLVTAGEMDMVVAAPGNATQKTDGRVAKGGRPSAIRISATVRPGKVGAVNTGHEKVTTGTNEPVGGVRGAPLRQTKDPVTGEAHKRSHFRIFERRGSHAVKVKSNVSLRVVQTELDATDKRLNKDVVILPIPMIFETGVKRPAIVVAPVIVIPNGARAAAIAAITSVGNTAPRVVEAQQSAMPNEELSKLVAISVTSAVGKGAATPVKFNVSEMVPVIVAVLQPVRVTETDLLSMAGAHDVIDDAIAPIIGKPLTVRPILIGQILMGQPRLVKAVTQHVPVEQLIVIPTVGEKRIVSIGFSHEQVTAAVMPAFVKTKGTGTVTDTVTSGDANS